MPGLKLNKRNSWHSGVEVLHILGTADPEGTSIARIVAMLANGLAPKRYRFHAWFLRGHGPLAVLLQTAGVQVRTFNWWRGARDPFGLWIFWRALRRENFAIVHQHFGGRSVRWLARLSRQGRIIVHLHGRGDESLGLKPLSTRIRYADSVIATSKAASDVAVDWRPHVVYPAVDVPNSNPTWTCPRRCESDGVIGTARRLIPIKGVIYLIRAFALLRHDIPGARLEIAGSGPEQPLLEREVQLLGLRDAVRFLGWQADIESALKRWDIFVLPSLEEGFGVAALEAMAAGLPVIASAVGGVPELVEDGRTGLLVPPADAAALADRLRLLLLNPMLRQSMGNAGRDRAHKCFSSEQMIEKISRIYDGLICE